MLSTLIHAGITAIFAGMALGALWHLRWVRRLPSLAALMRAETVKSPPAKPVRCSVIIAGRDEEARIEQTVRHVLAQRGVEIELIVVDDRSTDRTGEILHRLAAGDARLIVKRVEVLPAGWLGKCHACHLGASAATGDWILFTDADCWLKPDVIERALRVAAQTGADHVAMTPGTVIEGAAAAAWHLLFLTSILNWISGVNRDQPRAYVGIGAFNLVRADAYRECGGYEALRLTVLDDLRLGLLLRRAGKRTRAFLGVDDVECHWGATVGGMIKIMEKNYFAVTDFQWPLVAAGSVAVILVLLKVIAGLFSGTVAGLVAAFSPGLLIVPAMVLARRVGWAPSAAIWVPFMIPVFHYALLNSTFTTLRQGGIRWRDTFYPLEMLRKGMVK